MHIAVQRGHFGPEATAHVGTSCAPKARMVEGNPSRAKSRPCGLGNHSRGVSLRFWISRDSANDLLTGALSLLGIILLSALSLPDRREGGSGGSRCRRPLELSSGGSKFPWGQALRPYSQLAPVNVAHEPLLREKTKR